MVNYEIENIIFRRANNINVDIRVFIGLLTVHTADHEKIVHPKKTFLMFQLSCVSTFSIFSLLYNGLECNVC